MSVICFYPVTLRAIPPPSLTSQVFSHVFWHGLPLAPRCISQTYIPFELQFHIFFNIFISLVRCLVVGYIWRYFCVIFGTLGLHLGTFLGTFGPLGRPWDPLWAPLGARGEKVRKTTPFYNEKLVNFEYIFCIFSQKNVFFEATFSRQVFLSIFDPSGTLPNLKNQRKPLQRCTKTRFLKNQKRRPRGGILARFWSLFGQLF